MLRDCLSNTGNPQRHTKDNRASVSDWKGAALLLFTLLFFYLPFLLCRSFSLPLSVHPRKQTEAWQEDTNNHPHHAMKSNVNLATRQTQPRDTKREGVCVCEQIILSKYGTVQ